MAVAVLTRILALVMASIDTDEEEFAKRKDAKADDLDLIWFCNAMDNWKALVYDKIGKKYYDVTYSTVRLITYIHVYTRNETLILPDEDETEFNALLEN